MYILYPRGLRCGERVLADSVAHQWHLTIWLTAQVPIEDGQTEVTELPEISVLLDGVKQSLKVSVVATTRLEKQTPSKEIEEMPCCSCRKGRPLAEQIELCSTLCQSFCPACSS